VPKQSLEYNLIFHALADDTRRTVLERLGYGPATASQLAAPFDMALPSFMQHLGVLEKSGLVRSSKTGRVRTYTLEPAALQHIQDWVFSQRNIWERRFDQLEELFQTQLETPKGEPK
jgi:DNA-binding transcriptional ArsR family regulator